MKLKFVLAALVVALVLFTSSPAVTAEWIWRPDVGWINTRDVIKATAEEQWEFAKKLEEEKDFSKAARAYRLLEYTFSDSKLAGPASIQAGRCLFHAGNNYSAFIAVKRAVARYPATIDLNDSAQLLNEIGNRFLSGAKREFLGIPVFSGKSAAVEVFTELHSLDPWGDLGDDSMMGLGEAHMKAGDYGKAVESYQQLLNDYPDSPLRARARLQQAKCYDLSSKNWSYDFLPLSRAAAVLREINPEADIAAQAEELREVIEDRLARKAYETGKFYTRRDKYIAAGIYFRKVIDEFPGTLWAEKARAELNDITAKIEAEQAAKAAEKADGK